MKKSQIYPYLDHHLGTVWLISKSVDLKKNPNKQMNIIGKGLEEWPVKIILTIFCFREIWKCMTIGWLYKRKEKKSNSKSWAIFSKSLNCCLKPCCAAHNIFSRKEFRIRPSLFRSFVFVKKIVKICYSFFLLQNMFWKAH